MIDFEKKIALIGAITGLIGVVASPAISWITTKVTIESQIQLQKMDRNTELDKIKLEKTIQIKNDAYADLLLGFNELGETIFFAEYRPEKDSENNIVKTLLIREQKCKDKIFLAYYKIYPLIKSQNIKRDSEKLVRKIITQYSEAGVETLKPGMNMNFKQLDIIAQKDLPIIQHNLETLKTMLNEELSK